ncbi:Structural maintenance of chromosomes protein 6 [Rhizophlyctis rosea]|uniref:Structural maintenance of chromosomes protein 6 n=1 Tax=Rhizophlyctis rosea TaxID=64517 RepID=A0AAD5X2X8_9FUNG|nr:Structural maintenance of chromosomes protein 6 [Rhizophlyctis rosea]
MPTREHPPNGADSRSAQQKRHHADIASDSEAPTGPKRPRRSRETIVLSTEESETENAVDEDSEQEERVPQWAVRKSAGSRQQETFGDVDAGTVESVKLFNFMCHKSVLINLGPKINFIVGRNGSGKSAVLTALTVCLGGTPRATGRATAVKDLLREGSNNGSVTVRLRNKGMEGYKQHEYGDYIEIERRIAREGQSSYKISGADGRTISTKKEELLEICNHFQIQPDNPMAVLTQDTAKSFLASSDPHEKYQLYMTGTQLKQLSQDHGYLKEQINFIESTILRKKENLIEAEKTEQRIEEVKAEVAWSQIVEYEAEGEKKRLELVKQERKLAEVLPRLEQARASLREMEAESEALHEEVKTLAENAEPIKARIHQHKEDRKTRHRQIQEIVHEERNVDQSRQSVLELRQELVDKINMEKQKLERDLQAMRAAKAAKLAEKEARKNDVVRRITECRTQRDSLEAEISHIEKQRQNGDAALRKLNEDCNQINQSIDQLRMQKTNRLTAFGRRMPELLRAVDQLAQSGRWKGRKPIGPFGIHVKLTEPKYRAVIESLLYGTLGAFAVETHDDLLVLQQLFDRFDIRGNPILKYSNQKIDFSRGFPDPRFKTVFHVLEIDNEVVRDQLVINEAIEQRVLVDNRAEGDHITSRGSPENVAGVYTTDLYSMGARGGGLGTQVMREVRGTPRLGGDVDELIRMREQQLEEKKAESHRLQMARGETEKQYRELGRQRQMGRTTLAQLEREARNCDAEIREIEEGMREDESVNIAELEEAVKNQDRDLVDFNEKLEILEGQKGEIMNAIAPIDEQIKQAKNELDVLHQQFQAKSARLTELGTSQVKLRSDAVHWEKQQEAYQAHVEDLRQKYERAMEELRYYTQKAEEFSERVPITKPSKFYEDELSRLYARLRAQTRENGDVEQISAELQLKQAAYRTAKMEVQDALSFADTLRDSLAARIEIWEEFKRSVAARARLHFSNLMSVRGYNGKLLLNYEKGTLNIVVRTEEHGQQMRASKKGKEKDPKALSGGEKSFSTVCLLLALWDAMGPPFRALDEFDVFMDAVNRKMSMKLMLDEARTRHGCQYIFITPQGMSGYDGMLKGPDVKIFEMQEPERGGLIQTQLTVL